jgi:aminoglycoside phosphotransferase (APT) family kinase protein
MWFALRVCMSSHPPLLDPLRARALLQGIVADSGWRVLEVRSVELIKERPGRRRTFRYRLVTEHGTGLPRETIWYGQAYRGPEGERAFRAIHTLRLAAPHPVRFPEPLGFSPEGRLLVMTSLPGTSLAEALAQCSAEGVTAILTYVGGALAQLHSLGRGLARTPAAPVVEPYRERQVTAALERAVERVGESDLPERLRGAFVRAGESVASDLARAEAPSSRSAALAHRHLHPDAIIVDTGGIGLLDPDEIVIAEPELDLGALTAHLILDDVRRHGALRSAPGRIEALQSGYGSSRELRRDRLAVYTAFALLEIASDPDVADAHACPFDRSQVVGALLDESSCLESIRRLC